MNRRLTYILTLGLLLLSGVAMGQRNTPQGDGNTQSEPHVIVGGRVFGGGNKANVKGSSSVLIDQKGAVIGTLNEGTLVENTGEVYGGGALADVNVTMVVTGTGANADTSYIHTDDAITTVTILKGIVRGNVYGGGLGKLVPEVDTVAAKVYGEVTVNIGEGVVAQDVATSVSGKATIQGSVFGCNNIYGSPLDNVNVNIFKTAHNDSDTVTNLTPTATYAIDSVFGGGNKASYLPASDNKKTTVHVYTCNNTIRKVYGGGNAADIGTNVEGGHTSSTNIIIDGGRFEWVFGGGNGSGFNNPGANIYDDVNITFRAGDIKYFFGGSNEKGVINGQKNVDIKNDIASCIEGHDNHITEFYGGNNKADITSGGVSLTMVCPTGDPCKIDYVYGGSREADITGDVTLNIEGGLYDYVFGGNNISGVIDGNVTLNLYGGTINKAAFGGNNAGGEIKKAITVNVFDQGSCALQVDTIYGGGQEAAYTPDLVEEKKIVSPVVNLWNGTVGHTVGGVTTPGCVFGGGKGSGAKVTAHPKVMIGDDIAGHAEGNQIIVLNGSVFGGGNAAQVDGIDSVLMLKANSQVVNLFGGGNRADADSTVIWMKENAEIDTIFGGGNLAGLEGTAFVKVTSGTMRGGIYGGSNKNGNVTGDIIVSVNGGTVGTSHTARANVHGGGYGSATSTKGDVEVNINGATVYGDIYGGSGFGDVNAAGDTTTVNILAGTIYGDIYGGGLGRKAAQGVAAAEAKVYGKVFVNVGEDVNTGSATISTYEVSDHTFGGNVFGCNNANGSPLDSVFVNIYSTNHGDTPALNAYPTDITTVSDLAGNSATQTYAIQSVYGGGNEAAYTPALADGEPRSTTVHVYGCRNNTVKDVYGGGNAANVGSGGDDGVSANTFVIIDGGRINRVFGGGKGDKTNNVAASIYGTATTTVYAGLIDTIFGGSNQNGTITAANLILATESGSNCTDKLYNQVFGGANVAAFSGNLNTTINCGVGTIGDIYGGSNLADINGTGNVTLNIKGGTYNNVFGGSRGSNDVGANISGNVVLNLEGGEMVNAFGGSNVKGNIKGSITVNVEDIGACPLVVDTIYGGGQDAAYTPDLVSNQKIVSPVVKLYKGTVGRTVGEIETGCVFGGGKGTGAMVTAHPKVIIGDTLPAHSAYQCKVLGNVFGGGNAAQVDGIDSVLMLKANSTVVNLFGGGNKAQANSTVVMMTAGTVDTIFGGGNKAGLSGAALVTLIDGTVNKGIYGGCNSSGIVTGNILVNVDGGNIGNESAHANVHGGGYGSATGTSGNVEVNIAQTGATSGATIWGDVYGGSALGSVNGTAANTSNHTYVTLNKGIIHGDLYGGGLGNTGHAAMVYSPVQVAIYGGTVIGTVYGCNNASGAPQSTVKVDVYGTDAPGSGLTYALSKVFGGGNQAECAQTPEVTIHGCNNTIGYVYGGGNKAKVGATDVKIYGGNIGEVYGGGNGEGVADGYVMVTGNVADTIYGGVIGKVFGGNNTKGGIGGDVISVYIDKETEEGQTDPCSMKIGEVYGGGNHADGKAGTITIGCTGDWTTTGENNHTNHNTTTNRIGYELEGIGTVYGGANQAGISNNITLNINSGIVENVFGGNNTDGEIDGTITVNIEKTGDCDWYVGNVYGGGNLAAYSPTTTTNYPAVNIKNGTVSGNVFGGGLGTSAKVRSNPKVTVGDLEHENYEAVIVGNVYGGGSAAMVGDDYNQNPSVNNTTVLVQQANSSVAKVFGGGMAAGVTGTSTVTVSGGSVVNSIFGGCDTEGTVSGNIVVNVTGGEIGTHDMLYDNTPIIAQVFGGGFGHQTSTGGNVTVNIGTDNDSHSATPTIWGDVYGGSAEGNVNPETGESTTTVNVYNGTLESNIIQNNDGFKVYYGGNVYGGGLGTTGHPAAVYGTVGVNIGAAHTNSDPTGAATIKGNVYGCNNAKGTPKKDVTVNVYKTYQSGSNEFNYEPTPGAPATYAIANVFGGGNEADYEPGSNSNKANVNIVGCYNTIERVFGGSNAAASGTADHPIDGVFTTIDGGRIDKVFGGGNGEVSAANINGDVTLAIHGGSVNQFFVGSNQQGSVSGESHVTADNSSCPFVIDEFFCGGNYAPIHGNVITTIDCGSNVAGMQINNLYGGCNMADILDDEATTDVEGNVQLTVKGGSYKNIYGGSKGSPAPTGPDVTEEDLDAASADISGNVTLNIFGGTVTEAIYGGSNVNGSIGGNITVTIEDQNGEGDCPLDVEEADVYGAGNLAIYTAPSGIGAQANNPTVYINHAEVKNVFGGGKGDEQVNTQVPGMVTGNPKVFIGDSNGSHTAAVKESVYGGGNAAKVVGATTVVMQNAHSTVAKDIYGGGNLANVTGATTVDVNNGAVTQDVYGGGALANTNGSNVTLGGGTVRDIYGGGLGDEDHPAEVSGAVQVTVNNGTVVDVFGCNNVKGAPTSTVQVNINNNVTNSVYGGGNQAACSVSPAVYINKGVVGGNVFGGGLGEGAIVTGTPTVTIGDLTNGENAVATVTGDVYGGGDAAKVKGTTSVLVQKCNTVINGDVYGGGNAADIAKNNGAGGSTSVAVTGGTINSSNADHGNVFGGGHGNQSTNTSANVEGNTSVAINGGTINRVFGGANSKGDIGGSTSVFVEKDDDACSLHITEVYGGGNVADGKAGLVTIVCTGDGANEGVGDVYGGARAAGVTGDITLNITGGKIDNVFGGNNVSGVIDGKITVNVDWGTDCDNNSIGNVYGGGNQAAYTSPMTSGENPVHTNYPEVNILKGTVSTNVFGGGLGEDALVTGNPVVNINGGTVTSNTFGGGSAAPVKGNPTVNAKKGNATTVFGGGWGATAVVTGDPTVVVNQTSGESLNVTDVYGGGDQAEVEGNTNVQLKAGSVSNAYGGGNVADITGTTTVSLEGATAANIYGGGNQANVSNTTTVSVSSGNATTGVYGGCNTSGEVGGKVTVSVTGGTMGIAPTGTPGQEGYNAGQRANVHGGGYGNGTSTKGDVDVTIDGASAVIWGDVYGGSAKGHVNDADADKTNVTLNHGTIHGDLYGGGLGDANNAALVKGAVQVTVNGGTVTGSVYGCNNASGAPQSTVKVDIYDTDHPGSGYALGHVFGGGNQAAYPYVPEVKIHNCNNSIEYVYGGGNAANVNGTDVTIYGGNSIAHVFGGCYGADVTNDGTDVKIYGGTIDTIYGGNNESGTITGNIRVTVNKTADTDPNGSSTACEMHINEVYGGGNKAASNAGQITIGCTGTGTTEGIQYVYGGANRADVTGPINLKIEEGRIANVFGGNNNSGAITGAINVTIEKKASPCIWDIGNVFGGGNLAEYSGTPSVNVKNGTVANVYGGGNGDPDDDTQVPGQVTGTNVTIGDDTESNSAIVTGNVYGGGNAAKVSGNTLVVYNDSNSTSSVSNLFGGGNQAGVTGTTQVTLTNGSVTTGVYGGCNEKGNIGGKVTVNVSGGTVGSLSDLESTHTTADVFGGGYGQQTSTSNDVEVNVGVPNSTEHSDFPKIYGDVYGGSALGNVNAQATDKTTVNIYNGTLYSEPGIVNGFTVYYGGNVYGGGLGRKDDQNTAGVNEAVEAKVFGEVTVNIGSGTVTEGFTPSTNTGEATINGNVYGCNNANGSPQQNVTVNIFKTAHTTTDTYNYDPAQNGNVPATYALANVFGGGNEADFQINGKTATVNVYGCDNTIQRTFGGSNAAASNSVFTMIQGGRILEAYGGGNGEVKPANVNGNVSLAIHGGSVGQSFGGSNQQGTITGSSTVTVDSHGGCGEPTIEEYFCGGNFADYYGDIDATIECADGMHIKNLYGGCKQADVLPSGNQIGNVHLVVKGGTYENIFGGSQGRLANTDPDHPDAKSADISGHILLEIFGGTVTNAIYGGSHILGDVKGTITVNIENKNTGCPLDLSEADVYGGGNQADYKTPTIGGKPELHDYPQVNIKNATVKNVFGGGLEAEVKGNPQIRIKKGSKVLGNVYGGGNLGEVDGDPRVIVNGKDDSDNPTDSLEIEIN